MRIERENEREIEIYEPKSEDIFDGYENKLKRMEEAMRRGGLLPPPPLHSQGR